LDVKQGKATETAAEAIRYRALISLGKVDYRNAPDVKRRGLRTRQTTHSDPQPTTAAVSFGGLALSVR